MRNVAIKNISYVEAPFVRTSKEIGKQLSTIYDKFGLELDFIYNLTGVYERRFWLNDKSITDIATLSVEKLIEESNIDKNKIGCFVNCSVGLDYGEPTVSIVVHNNLGMPKKCITFDVSNACMGFTNATDIVCSMIKTEQIDYGIIFAGENCYNIMNSTIDSLNDPDTDFDKFQRSFAALTLGSGSVAILLGPAEEDDHIIEKTLMLTDSKYWNHCVGALDRSWLDVDAANMMKDGMEILTAMEEYTKTHYPQFHDNNIDIYIPHQVSTRHNDVLCDSTTVNRDKLYVTYPYLGNVGPASWPITLYLAVEDGSIKKGDFVGICSVGSGFNCGVTGVKW